MKEDALQKGLLVPDQAAVRGRVLAKKVEAPDLATVKDFFHFCAATAIESLEDLLEMDLMFKDSVLDLPILRKCTKGKARQKSQCLSTRSLRYCEQC